MRIVRTVVVALFLGGAVAACGSAPRPVPVLAHADSTAGLRVRISDKTDLKDDEDDGPGENLRAHHELVMRLREAGYVVVQKGPYDLRATTTFTIEKSKHDVSFTWARVRLRDRKGNIVDDITLEFRGGIAPASNPNIVAVSLVNEMTKSPKLSTFAQQKRAKAAQPEAKPAAKSEAKEATPEFAP